MKAGNDVGCGLVVLGAGLACCTLALFFGPAWGFALSALLCVVTGAVLLLKR